MKDRTDERHIGEIGDREQSGAQPVVDVVVVVGDIVGERGDLRLGARGTGRGRAGGFGRIRQSSAAAVGRCPRRAAVRCA